VAKILNFPNETVTMGQHTRENGTNAYPPSIGKLSRAFPVGLGHKRDMTEPDLKTNLRRILQERGRSARDVSLSAGFSESAVKHILRGRSQNPSKRMLQAIAAELSVSVADLFRSGSDPLPPDPSKLSELVEDPTELRLLRYWRVLNQHERSYMLNLIRRSALGE
jgi:transcriptional regulator with XRE-family HTH domain